jgi:hypothetical protein
MEQGKFNPVKMMQIFACVRGHLLLLPLRKEAFLWAQKLSRKIKALSLQLFDEKMC